PPPFALPLPLPASAGPANVATPSTSASALASRIPICPPSTVPPRAHHRDDEGIVQRPDLAFRLVLARPECSCVSRGAELRSALREPRRCVVEARRRRRQ